MALRTNTTQRREVGHVPSMKRYLDTLPPDDKKIMKASAQDLSDNIKNMGEGTALEVLWAVGRLLNRELLD